MNIFEMENPEGVDRGSDAEKQYGGTYGGSVDRGSKAKKRYGGSIDRGSNTEKQDGGVQI